MAENDRETTGRRPRSKASSNNRERKRSNPSGRSKGNGDQGQETQRSSHNRGNGGSRNNNQNRGGSNSNGPRRKKRNNRNRNRNREPEVDMQVAEEDLQPVYGLVEVMHDGHGFIRALDNYYLQSADDVYVPAGMLKKLGVKTGSMIRGDFAISKKRGGRKVLYRINQINDRDPELHASEKPFKNLTACDPYERLMLEVPNEPDTSMRIIDLLTPIGKGQRALIVAPPRTGKTVIMQKMANAIIENHPDVKVIILLIDERPEEVTDMRRNTKAEVVASCLDEGTANHVKVTEIVLERVKREVEAGNHVVCLLDSVTRLGRAYNNETKHSGRILSGGVDAKTLAKPKAFFGAARAIEDGGSLTIIATALIDTGSRMDQVIFEEFKGTGNMEVVLSRQLANNRIFPAIDIAASGTRKEEKLLDADVYNKVIVLRRVLNQLKPMEAMRLLVERMEKSSSNADFLEKFKF